MGLSDESKQEPFPNACDLCAVVVGLQTNPPRSTQPAAARPCLARPRTAPSTLLVKPTRSGCFAASELTSGAIIRHLPHLVCLGIGQHAFAVAVAIVCVCLATDQTAHPLLAARAQPKRCKTAHKLAAKTAHKLAAKTAHKLAAKTTHKLAAKTAHKTAAKTARDRSKKQSKSPTRAP